MENGRMDSSSNPSSKFSQRNMDIGGKENKACFSSDSSIKYQNIDDGNLLTYVKGVPLMENDFSTCNGTTSLDHCASFGIVIGNEMRNARENDSCKTLTNNVNSSQRNFDSKILRSSDVEDELLSLTLNESESVEVTDLTSVRCSSCNDIESQRKITNEEAALEEMKCPLNSGHGGHSEQKLTSIVVLPAQDMNSPIDDNVDGHGDSVENEADDTCEITYISYESENQMPDIMKLIQKDLSEPYSIYTYRYFIHNWPHLCFLAVSKGKSVGAIVCKLDLHRKIIKRGYIAMLAVDECYRKKGIGSNLVLKAIRVMAGEGADEVVLETEITNQPALRLYENLGFVRDKRLFRYYLNGVDALRLKLWLR